MKSNNRWKSLLLGVVIVGMLLTLTTILAGLQRPARDWNRFAPVRDPSIDHVVGQLNLDFADLAQQANLEVAERAPWHVVSRRVSLALVGSGLSLEEVRALEQVPEAERVDRWTELLLKDRRWEEYFGERLARAFVGTEQGPFLLFRRRRFRLWLSEELQKGTPYDQIVRAMISSKGLWTDSPAVNFVTATLDPDQPKKGDPIRLAGRTSRAFLGMRIDCMECHNDFLDKVDFSFEGEPVPGKQEHFHGLAAFYADATLGEAVFAGLRDQESPYIFKFLDADKEVTVPPSVPFLSDLVPSEGTKREKLAAWVTNPKNPAFARATVNRFWALMTGKGLMEPVDDLPLRGPFPPMLEHLAADFTEHGYDVRRLIRTIVKTEAFQRSSTTDDFEVTDAHEDHWAVFPVMQLRPEQVAGSLIQACQLEVIDRDSSWLTQLVRFGEMNDFLKAYGDRGDDELLSESVTIPQRLLLMNGNLVRERTQQNPITNASSRIAILAADDREAITTTYLAVLNRAPSEAEIEHFLSRLEGKRGGERQNAISDIYWVLVNSTEFLWNH